MTTDKIIRDEFEQLFGKENYAEMYDDEWELYIHNRGAFSAGWEKCEQWHERQRMMDKDYQEQVQEEARLAEGR